MADFDFDKVYVFILFISRLFFDSITITAGA